MKFSVGKIDQAIGWNLGAHAIQALSIIVQAVIVSRVLSPTDIGYFAIARSVLSLSRAVPNTGILYAMASLKNLRVVHSRMVSGIMLAAGAIQAFAMIGGALIFGSLSGHQYIVLSIILLSGLCLIDGQLLPVEGLKVRSMDHRQLTIADLLAFGSAVTGLLIGLAWGLGVFSLVLASYMESIPKVIYLRTIMWKETAPLFPRLKLISAILSQGAKLSISSVFLLISTQGDRLLIGTFLGPAIAASYWRANQALNVPLSFHARVAYRVLISTASAESTAGITQQRVASLSTVLSARLGLCIGLGSFFLADPLILLFLGDAWSMTAISMVALAPCIGSKFLIRSLDSLLVGGSHVGSSVLGQGFLAIGLILAIALGFQGGLWVVCIFISVVFVLGGLLYSFLALRANLLTQADFSNTLLRLSQDTVVFCLPFIGLHIGLGAISAPKLISTAIEVLFVLSWFVFILLDLNKEARQTGRVSSRSG